MAQAREPDAQYPGKTGKAGRACVVGKGERNPMCLDCIRGLKRKERATRPHDRATYRDLLTTELAALTQRNDHPETVYLAGEHDPIADVDEAHEWHQKNYLTEEDVYSWRLDHEHLTRYVQGPTLHRETVDERGRRIRGWTETSAWPAGTDFDALDREWEEECAALGVDPETFDPDLAYDSWREEQHLAGCA